MKWVFFSSINFRISEKTLVSTVVVHYFAYLKEQKLQLLHEEAHLQLPFKIWFKNWL